MTAAKPPSPAQVRRALTVLARAWGDGWELADPVPAHVEFVSHLGGSVETWRVFAQAGPRDVLLAQVPRAALEMGGAR